MTGLRAPGGGVPARRAGIAEPPGHRRALVALVIVSTLMRLAAALTVPLLYDEAHYWVWARHLMWGYPDHPPMIAGLVALGTRLLGDTVIAIRLFPVLLGSASTLVIYALTRTLFSPQAGLRAALLFQVVPAFVAGGIMAAPDAPMGLFWPLAMLFAWMATRGSRWAWPAAGAAVGLVIQSKMAGGALAVALAGFVLARHRGRLREPGPVLAALAGAVVLAPLAWWNVTHDWATLKRVLVADLWIPSTSILSNVAIYTGVQLVFYAPLGFAILVAGLLAAAARARRDERFQFLLWCAVPTLAVVALASMRALAKPHYTGPALLSGLIAAAALWPQWRPQRLLRVGVASSLALTLLVLVVASVPTPLSADFHREAAGWARVAREIERVLPEVGAGEPAFILAETYQVGSQIAFATRDRFPLVVPFRGFALWEPPEAWIGRRGLLVDHLGGTSFQIVARTFERLSPPYVVPLGGGRAFRLYPGFNFRGLEGVPQPLP